MTISYRSECAFFLSCSMGCRLFLLQLLLLLPVFCSAQKRSEQPFISIGPQQLSERERFSITLHCSEKISTHDPFPDLTGFRKQGKSTSMKMQMVSGESKVQYSITQHYLSQKAGQYRMPTLRIRINGQLTTHPAAALTVKEGHSTPHKPSFSEGSSPFDQFFDVFEEPKEEEFVEVKDEAFLALTTSKEEVYVGEGFTATLSFYVAASNRAALSFHQLNEHITDLLNKLKPKGCWEESFPIQQIQPEQVQINNRPYTRHVIAKSVFYPLQVTDVVFSSVGLKMLKYKVSKSASIWGRRTQPAYKTFYSKAKRVRVKQLPPHPMREQVAVGRYRIVEEQEPKELRTGQGFNYRFKISGEGNISAIRAPQLREDSRLQLYPPQLSQHIYRSQSRVYGDKTLTYHILPQEAGTYSLSSLLQWTYFDPSRNRYDTLRPRLVLQVEGKNLRNLQIQHNTQDTFYKHLLKQRATSLFLSQQQRHWAAAALITITVTVLLLLFRRRFL